MLGSAHASSYKEDDKRYVDDEQQRSDGGDGDDDNPGQLGLIKHGRLGISCGVQSVYRRHTQTHRWTLTGLLLLEVPAPAVAADEDDVEEEQEGADGRHRDDRQPREWCRHAAGVVPVSDIADRRRTCRPPG